MRTIFRIMITELKVLFYSPVAWLILIVFTFQAGSQFCSLFGTQVSSQEMGYALYGVTNSVLGGYGLFSGMLDNIYLYIPLLTMGLMSRELSSGSIKLLYSSPVTNFQIIFGKYLSIMVYGLLLIAVLLVSTTVGYFGTENMDLPMVLTGLLGIFLTLCAYGAIGLFMSTVTHYQVVAAIGTLVVLAVLNYVGKIGQDISFVRDITYWLSISGRSQTFLSGLLCSKDIIYFLLVISMFICFSIFKLQGELSKDSKWISFSKYGSVLLIVLIVGYISSRPMMIKYYDSTANQGNTLTPESQAVMKNLTEDLTIKTYVNFIDDNYHKGNPAVVNNDKKNFEGYVRFKPDIKMEYIYYYDTTYNASLDMRYPDLNFRQRFDTLCKLYDLPTKMFKTPEQMKKILDLESEGNRFVRLLEYGNGKKRFLRIYNDQQVDPSESEITTALKTLIEESPKVGFVVGHNERAIAGIGDRGFSTFAADKSFRHSLVNQGFEVVEVTMESAVNEEIDILVVSDMRSGYNDVEMANFDNFLARGGNMIILGEPRRQENMNPLVAKFGLKFTDGLLVQPRETISADVMTGSFTNFALNIKGLANMIGRRYCVTMPSACGIETIAPTGYEIEPLIVTAEKGVWNEKTTTNFIDEVPSFDPSEGEVEKSYDLMVYAKRYVKGKEQRIFVIGDADCIGNGEITMRRKDVPASNYSLIITMFQELSYGKYPIVTTRTPPKDNRVFISSKAMKPITLFLKWIFPSLLALAFCAIWYIRRGR